MSRTRRKYIKSFCRSLRQNGVRQGSFRHHLVNYIHIGEAFTLTRILIIILLVILLLLPTIWGPQIIPYRLGQILRQPIYARLDFSWENTEEVKKIKVEMEGNLPRHYREESQWVYMVFDPVYNFLNKCYTLVRNEELQSEEALSILKKFALSQKLKISDENARIIFMELRREQHRIGLFDDIIRPTRVNILKGKIFSVGLMSNADHLREFGRRIHVVSAWWEEDSELVGSREGPISMAELPRLLEAYFDGEFQSFSSEFRKAYQTVIEEQLKPSLHYAAADTKKSFALALGQRVKRAQQVSRGQLLMPAGQSIKPVDLNRIRAEIESFQKQKQHLAAAERVFGMGALLFIAALGFLLYLSRFESGVFQRSKQLTIILFASVVVMWLLQIGMMRGLHVSLVPIGVIAGVAALIFGPRVGVGMGSLLAYTSFVITRANIGEVLAVLGSSWVFSCLAPGVRHRSGLLRAGCLTGAVNFLGVTFWRLATGGFLSSPWREVGIWEIVVRTGAFDSMVWIFGSILLTVFLPLLEKIFDTATNIALLELSDQEHPCLRQLLLDAPGTYHHSVVVGNLAEAAAEAIGANVLLARVGSYYHDIGKVIKPEYFTENDFGHNRHDNLLPDISALIIISHVKNGVEMAKEYNLPQDIIDIIEQHHGDSLVSFFYRQAQEQKAENEEVSAAFFSYPGPQPHSVEAAIVMLADSVEAASRSLSEPTSARIKSLVQSISRQKLGERQFDFSPLAFRDIALIEASFVRTLTAMFHSRVHYPRSCQDKKNKG